MLTNKGMKVTEFAWRKLSANHKKPEMTGGMDSMARVIQERVEHIDLAALLWMRVALELDEAVTLFINICDRVAQYHDHDVVIGELNPDRVKLTIRNDEIVAVKIPVTRSDRGIDTLSLGTRCFVCPEIVRGDRPSVQSDIYSIGTMLHFAVHGVPLEKENRLNLFKLVVRKESVYNNLAESKLSKIISRCVDADPNKRYATLSELRADLVSLRQGRVLDHATSNGRRRRQPVRWQYQMKRYQRTAENIALILLLILIGPMIALFTPPRSLAVVQVPPTIETVWNKPERQYKYGDLFTITIVPKTKSYVYLFYVDDKDSVLALFPACDQENNIVSPEKPLKIDSIGNCCFRVDSSDGKIVVVSVEQSEGGKPLREKVLSKKDWIDTTNTTSKLRISGRQLLARLNTLSKKHANYICHSVEDAPKAAPSSSPRK